MNQLRWDPTLREWVAYASTARTARFYRRPSTARWTRPDRAAFRPRCHASPTTSWSSRTGSPHSRPTPRSPRREEPCSPPRLRGVASARWSYTRTTTATLLPWRGSEPDRGVGRPLRGARLRGLRRVRLYLREQGRGHRRHAAPPARPDLRLPFYPSTARQRARGGTAIPFAERGSLPTLRPPVRGARGRAARRRERASTAFVPFYAHFPYEAHLYAGAAHPP